MRPRRLSIHVRLVGPSDGRTLQQEVHHICDALYFRFSQPTPEDVPGLVLSDLHERSCASLGIAEQVYKLFIVDLDEPRIIKKKNRSGLALTLLDLIEDLCHSSWDNSDLGINRLTSD
jgi:hypothetical protein